MTATATTQTVNFAELADLLPESGVEFTQHRVGRMNVMEARFDADPSDIYLVKNSRIWGDGYYIAPVRYWSDDEDDDVIAGYQVLHVMADKNPMTGKNRMVMAPKMKMVSQEGLMEVLESCKK